MNLLESRINLDAIAHNTATLKRLVAPAKLMCVLKADAYNHGAVAVAPVMEAAGADAFGVATMEEAHALLDAGVQVPITCWLWSPTQDPAAVLDAGITLAVASKSQAERVIAHGRGRVVIKVDTGMHRSGLIEDDWHEVMTDLHNSNVDVQGLMSHFALADDPAQPLTGAQVRKFEQAIALGRSIGLELACNHIANSPAALNIPEARFDMVRAGLSLFGEEPVVGEDHGLQPALRWVGTVTMTKPVSKGAGVSYGHTWHAPEEGVIAVVSAGYADGLPRSAQGHLEVAINGQRYPQVGRVCMDQFLIYLGDNPKDVRAGEEVEILGGQATAVSELAASMGTINYEVMCMLGGRTRRVYSGGVKGEK
ncbi:alanine racemase [Corynebacterium gerontici]|nr:alanine racemase [Corynebacterium gerontici]